MTQKGLAASALVPRKGAGTLAQLSAHGIYQFRGSGGEKITIVNKEKLRASSSRVQSKSNK
jgi:hypothetical protein